MEEEGEGGRGGASFHIWQVVANTVNKQSWKADKEKSSNLGIWCTTIVTPQCKETSKL